MNKHNDRNDILTCARQQLLTMHISVAQHLLDIKCTNEEVSQTFRLKQLLLTTESGLLNRNMPLCRSDVLVVKEACCTDDHTWCYMD